VSGTKARPVVGRWRNVGRWVQLTREELDSSPVGCVRSFALDDVVIAAWRSRDGQWRTLSRKVPARLLADLPSIERVRREDEPA